MARQVARHLEVRGKVQGVFFRASTRQVAREAGIGGWVANRADGAVEAWLEGEVAAVETVEAWMATGGPPAADVEQVHGTDEQPRGFTTFEVRREVDGFAPDTVRGP